MKAICHLIFFALLFAGAGAGAGACYWKAPPENTQGAQQAVPLVRLDSERGATLFSENCAACHGETGTGDGHRAKQLSGPRPRNFQNASMMVGMSPNSAFEAMTHGVNRTSMTAFDLLGNTDRWNLAFYLMSFGHAPEDAKSGAAVSAQTGMSPTSNRGLAALSNGDILQHFKTRNQDEQAARAGLAYLRLLAPFEGTQTPLSRVRHYISDAINAYRRGEHGVAKDTLAAVHLDVLDAQLNVVRLRDSSVALGTDQEMRELRRRFQASSTVVEIEDAAQMLTQRLDTADVVLAKPMSMVRTAVHAASLTLSFGIDGALALLLLVVLGSRRGCDKRERKIVGVGLVVGLIATVTLWLGWMHFAPLFTGSVRTYINMGVSSAIALLTVPFLLLIVQHFRHPPQTRMTVVVSWLGLLFLLSVSVLLRDALEVVPAIHALSTANSAAIYGFVGAGIGLIVLVSLLLQMLPRMRVNARTALLTMTTTTVAVMAAGSAARAAQNLGLLDSHHAGSLQSPWMSLWPTSESVMTQLFIATSCLITLTLSTLLIQSTPKKAKPFAGGKGLGD